MPQAVGAFVLAGALIAATGAIRPLGRLIASIPDGIAAGMLAGVLLPFVLRLPGAVQAGPGLVLAVIAAFALIRRAAMEQRKTIEELSAEITAKGSLPRATG